jgi:predicted DNA-binding transcriptional regulator YafY
MKEVVIDYTNWRGHRAERRIRPLDLRFGSSQWHLTDQWLLHALDVDKDEIREFAMRDIHSWRQVNEA